ncbi:XRE family transcriptional regulator [Rothia nasimurium]|uniref:XRE family transcriptional regulator n=1 Tax=Rothia nasimurium TaxID=85336 RepID=A0A4Y9F1V0_9MICC|nr:helix-turn-helix transcriptional regulator [Rothia nasimurium]MBF0808850.1 helix-turn-helix transcriptional regulator [Rothia nasimurium]TFU21229.1 XRE family transcriptional regulator [Rothia nasimurium]
MTLTQHETGRVPASRLRYRLLQAREEAELDQGQLSEKIGVSRTSISAAETGKSKPRRSTLILWAMATGVDLDWLLTGETKKAPSQDGERASMECARRDSNPQPSDP